MQVFEKERVGAALVFLFCIAAWLALDGVPAEAAFFPRLVIGAAAVLAAVWGITTVLKARAGAASDDPADRPTPLIAHPRNFLTFLACVIAYILLIGWAGYFTASALFIVGTSLLLGYERLLVSVPTSVLFVTLLYLIFVVIFERPLPIEFFQAR